MDPGLPRNPPCPSPNHPKGRPGTPVHPRPTRGSPVSCLWVYGGRKSRTLNPGGLGRWSPGAALPPRFHGPIMFLGRPLRGLSAERPEPPAGRPSPPGRSHSGTERFAAAPGGSCCILCHENEALGLSAPGTPPELPLSFGGQRSRSSLVTITCSFVKG